MVQDKAELFTVGPYDVIMPIVILSSWVLVIVAVWLVLKTDTSATNKILCCIAIFALPVIPAVAFIYLYYKKHRN